MTTIAAGTKFTYRIGQGEGSVEGVAIAAEAPSENGWFTAHDLNGGEWFLHTSHVATVYEEAPRPSLRSQVVAGIGVRLTVESSSLEGATGHASLRISEATGMPAKAVATLLGALVADGTVSVLRHHDTQWSFWAA